MECPGCHNQVNPVPVGFTWWGGVIGPKILNHVECPGCKTRFNGKSGRRNTTGIVIYSVVLGAIMVAILVAWKI